MIDFLSGLYSEMTSNFLFHGKTNFYKRFFQNNQILSFVYLIFLNIFNIINIENS